MSVCLKTLKQSFEVMKLFRIKLRVQDKVKFDLLPIYQHERVR